MTTKRPRDLALAALNRLPHKILFTDDTLDSLFQDNPNLDYRDRAFISHLVQGVSRWRLRLDWIIEQTVDFSATKITPHVFNILRMALYQIFFMDRVPESAAVNEAVRQAKRGHPPHVASFVNGILRNICRKKERISFPDRDRDLVRFLSVFYSYPPWLVRKWVREQGAESAEALLRAGNNIPGITLRVNSVKIDRVGLIRRLSEEGVKARPTPYSPGGIILDKLRGRIDELPLWGEGLFLVQDEAAQIISYILAPRPGEVVLDLCAGFGGKTTHLADQMGRKGRVIALDRSLGRLVSLSQTSRRLGMERITPLVADASGPVSNLFRYRFDRIMVDAPCSGLGVISRHPDAKWNRGEGDILRLSRLQSQILEQGASVLRRGGMMVYATCTVSKEENEGVVNGFLKRKRGFTLENIKDYIPAWGRGLINPRGFFMTLPHLHAMDGFFAALFKKR